MWRRAIAILLVLLATGITSCSRDSDIPVVLIDKPAAPPPVVSPSGTLAEVSPPETIQQLKALMAVYEPQVHIVQPQAATVLDETTVDVVLQVANLPVYKDADLELGPHVHLFLDDRPYQRVYDVEAPITLTDLAPGTHTLRAVAVRPWDESFKNAGAYDQVTFSVYTPSAQNSPDASKLLLTYGAPQGSYGTEPILLDFYLANAPLHLVAEGDEAIADWRIRCTINNETFVFDRWQPIYLKGFRPGTNWIKLEAIDEKGAPLDNVFNTTVRVIEYIPGGEDSLSKLIREEIPLAQAKVLVDPTYDPTAPVVEPEPVPVETLPETAAPEIPETPEIEAEDTETTTEAAASAAIAPAETPEANPDVSAGVDAAAAAETEALPDEPLPPAAALETKDTGDNDGDVPPETPSPEAVAETPDPIDALPSGAESLTETPDLATDAAGDEPTEATLETTAPADDPAAEAPESTGTTSTEIPVIETI